MSEFINLRIGAPYPMPVTAYEGAAAQLCIKGGGVIQIMMPQLMDSEKKLLKNAEMKAGLIVDQPLILLMLQFGDLIFECPFDARLIARDDLVLENIENSLQRLMITIHVIDTNSGLLHVLRGITFSAELTLKLYSAVQEQLVHTEKFSSMHAKYSNKSLEQLTLLAKMTPCGKP